MKTKTVLLVIVCAIVAGSVVYGVCHLRVLLRTTAEEAAVTCSLFDLQIKLDDYRRSHGRWPETLAELKLDESSMKDYISGKPFLYYSHANPSSRDVLVAQPEAFRAGLWPLGAMRRNVVLAIGEHEIFLGQDAVTIRPTS